MSQTMHWRSHQADRFFEGSLAWLTEPIEKLKTEELAHMERNLFILNFGLTFWQVLQSIHGAGLAGSLQGPAEQCARRSWAASSLASPGVAAATASEATSVLQPQRPQLCIISDKKLSWMCCILEHLLDFTICALEERAYLSSFSVTTLVTIPTRAVLVCQEKKQRHSEYIFKYELCIHHKSKLLTYYSGSSIVCWTSLVVKLLIS